MLKLMYITNKPQVARIAADAGVDRIFIDMEEMGKAERQGHMDSVKSHHTVADIRRVRAAVGPDTEILTRINPLYSGSAAEIDAAIDAGADLIMLPMWTTAEDVRTFVSLVGGRAKTMPLLETRQAAEALPQVLELTGVDEIHIGLNDLHLSYGQKFLFEPLANGTVDALCSQIRARGIPFGFGGVGRPGHGLLPAQHVLAEHYRLGSTIVILSRSFCNATQITDLNQIDAAFREGVARVRSCEASFSGWTGEDFDCNHRIVSQYVAQIVHNMESL